MKKETKVMSIGKYRFWSDVVDGSAMIIAGILAFFENIPCIIMCLIVLLVSIIVNTIVKKAEIEKNDEMSLHNLQEARATTQKRMRRLVAIVALVYLVSSILWGSLELGRISIPIPFLFIYLGVSGLSVGLEFRKLEEA